MPLSSRGHRRACDQRPIVIKRDPLVCDRDDDLERALRSVLGLSVLRQFRVCAPVLVFVPERSVIVPPRPVWRPKQELGMCGAYRKYENGKCCHYCRADGSHIDASGDRCRHGSLTALFSRIVVPLSSGPQCNPATQSKSRRIQRRPSLRSTGISIFKAARPFHGATRSRLTLHMPSQPIALDAGGVRSISRRGQKLRFGPLSATVQTTDFPLATLVTRSLWPIRSSMCAQTKSR